MAGMGGRSPGAILGLIGFVSIAQVNVYHQPQKKSLPEDGPSRRALARSVRQGGALISGDLGQRIRGMWRVRNMTYIPRKTGRGELSRNEHTTPYGMEVVWNVPIIPKNILAKRVEVNSTRATQAGRPDGTTRQGGSHIGLYTCPRSAMKLSSAC